MVITVRLPSPGRGLTGDTHRPAVLFLLTAGLNQRGRAAAPPSILTSSSVCIGFLFVMVGVMD